MRVFGTFVEEACALRQERGWTIDRVKRECNDFLRILTIEVVRDEFPDLNGHWINDWNGSVASDVERRFRTSAEWKQYEKLLLAPPLSAPVAQHAHVDAV